MFFASTCTLSASLHTLTDTSDHLTHFTKLDTHLVVRVDTPDSTLDVDLVLVQSDQSTEGTRVELLEHDAVGRLVSFKDLRLDEGSVR